MYYFQKTKVNPNSKMTHLIEENSALLLMMQHFEIDFKVGDLTVSQMCDENQIGVELFITVANLYNGFRPKKVTIFPEQDILQIIRFLKNSHQYYQFYTYPQISTYIHYLQENHPETELVLLENFFDEYFSEVLEHFDYEDNVAFPYFIKLLQGDKDPETEFYSAKEYSDHHTDIELKLKDLKNLLMKYISIEGDLIVRRKLFLELFELEYDLFIHSLIEETILIPLGQSIEKEKHA
ncbi:MAG TPA: hypothetical protein DDZ96_10375 [Porphyromonadaceae bacterium]|jgi:regulator of cell morphogenesis and NO signaling|uniref:hypothetical protein n=1 Tax=Limibacterium fermenti TaxID=3229863 RepID=UPI000E8A8735|nr:hypothetical protein [Porphyromonadaceae bacterium]HBK31636.1 hypothetical protein [Porphyromonadaceae bacterium]HBL34204.1 hypothetical protein [Porphyromonadaceae bacterium]HBX21870.1 hypothetical protein [Porphyromonadaceae bacterium]HBX44592.1 hypothetical protein [Porphyromonadaceae bacterium]